MAVLSAEMQGLRAIRNSRARFRADMLAAARAYRAEHPVDGTTVLTGEEVERFLSVGMEQVAELLFIQSDLALHKDPDRLERFLNAHNKDMTDLIAELQAQKRSKTEDGTTLTALKKSLFSDESIAGLKAAARFGGAYFSQSDVGRILTCMMSPETSRKNLEVLGDCGFVLREGSGKRPILSHNIVEELYRAHLRRILTGAQAIDVEREAILEEG